MSAAVTTDAESPEASLPMRKRKKADEVQEGRPEGGDTKLAKHNENDGSGEKSESVLTSKEKNSDATVANPTKRPPMSKAREIRLEQNRKVRVDSDPCFVENFFFSAF